MRRRLGLSLGMLLAGIALLAAAGLAGPAGGAAERAAADAPKGGTLRIGSHVNVDVDPGIGYSSSSWLISDATCTKLFDYSGRAGRHRGAARP